MAKNRLVMHGIGPVMDADITFGDLTVIVGPQATGKSVFLQALKLVLDRDAVHDVFKHHNVVFDGNPSGFLGGYFGKGMASAWRESSALQWNSKKITLPDLAKPSKVKDRSEHVFLYRLSAS